MTLWGGQKSNDELIYKQAEFFYYYADRLRISDVVLQSENMKFECSTKNDSRMMRKMTEDGHLPRFYTHQCSEQRKGAVMTNEELHDFAVEVLMGEYADTGALVERCCKQRDCEADFSFVGTGKSPQFTGRKVGKRVNVLVVCRDTLSDDISKVDTSWLAEEYRRTGAIPRVTMAYAHCYTSRNKDGQPAVCGGEFSFKYYSVSPIPGEVNSPVEGNLSDVELAVKYVESWRRMDASVVAPYLDKDFHYGSFWVFDEMPSRMEFLDYFEGKLDAIRRTGSQVDVSIGRDHQTGRVALIVRQDGETMGLELKTRSGRIVSAYMNEYDSKYKEMEPEDELYQNHGDHLDSIMPVRQLLKEYLTDIVDHSVPWRICDTQVTTDGQYESMSRVCSVLFGEGSLRILTTLARSVDSSHYEMLSFYPVAKGTSMLVHIDKVIEWDNQVEATVLCSIGEFHFAFFAVDYYCNKQKYKVGHTLSVDLAAIGLSVKEGQHGFQFEGQHAIDWLAKIGKVPVCGGDGNVEPVRFNLEHMVSYLNLQAKCPDEAEFQSPSGELDSTSILGIDFWKTDVTIYRRDVGEEDADEIKVPLYFRKDFFPEMKVGTPVCGYLWMTGCVTGMHDTSNADTYEPRLADVALEFESFVEHLDLRTFENLMPVLSHLPLLELREGYEFDAFCRGTESGWRFRPYCCKANPQEDYDPNKHGAYKDSLNIDGLLDCGNADKVPDALDYFSVPFTEQGIMQAWLLENVGEFMPKGRPSSRNMKCFIFDEKWAEEYYPVIDGGPEYVPSAFRYGSQEMHDRAMAIDNSVLFPSVCINGDAAILEYAYWNGSRGLIAARVEVKRYGQTVRFGEPEERALLEYHWS